MLWSDELVLSELVLWSDELVLSELVLWSDELVLSELVLWSDELVLSELVLWSEELAELVGGTCEALPSHFPLFQIAWPSVVQFFPAKWPLS